MRHLKTWRPLGQNGWPRDPKWKCPGNGTYYTLLQFNQASDVKFATATLTSDDVANNSRLRIIYLILQLWSEGDRDRVVFGSK